MMFYTTTDCDVQWDMYIFDFFLDICPALLFDGFYDTDGRGIRSIAYEYYPYAP